jgi:hypothetical protein
MAHITDGLSTCSKSHDFDRFYSYSAQVLPFHRRHLRATLRVWRIVVLATQTPLTRVLPGPQAATTGVIMLSGCAIGAGVIACTDVASDKAKPVATIHLIIGTSLPCPFFR